MIIEEVVVLQEPFYDALEHVKTALGAVGFGTLTEVDLQQVLKVKIDQDIAPYVIIGACNPRLASRALDASPQIGVLLPCNVVVRQFGEQVMVEAMDPGLMSSLTENQALAPIAAEARDLLNEALRQLTAAPELSGN